MRHRSPAAVAFPALALVAVVAGLGWLLLSKGPEVPESAPTAAAPEPASSAGESTHLASLRNETDPARALQLADEGHHQFPGGGLYAEREAIAIRSMVRLGQKEQAQGRARRFLRRFPEHPQAEMVRRMAGL